MTYMSRTPKLMENNARYAVWNNDENLKHEFLGMNIKYEGGKVVISMENHILKAIDIFMDDINREAPSPAKGYLFDVREDASDLNEERADNFHSVTASLCHCCTFRGGVD
ncbi:MAG: hypothetical protein SGBAC_013249 [Bacillariaceae sp.]